VDKVSNGRRRLVIGLLVAAGALLALAPAAFAKTYHPNKTGDSPSHGLSLREAVTNANNLPGFDKIILEAGKTYKLSIPNAGPPTENLNATGDLDILESLKIQSSGKKLATVTAQGIDRVFDAGPTLSSGVTAIFKRLKITGGSTVSIGPTQDGAGIQLGRGFSPDVLQLIKSVVAGNFSNDEGGGIYVEMGTLSISKSTIRNNHAEDTGGGIDDGGGQGFILNRSTINENTAGGDGGGIDAESGTFSAVNSTIANNSSATYGGGIDGGADSVSLSSVTVVRNRANSDNVGGGDGGGLSDGFTSPFIVTNSIIALNTVGPPATSPDCSDTFLSAGVNLFTNLTDCTGFGPPNLITSNPKLGFLKDNGGPTKTIELKKHSPAINNAGAGSPKRDQRGEKRHNPDIGAFERS
jgi:hypothetical protein